ncbi:FANCD2 opposite strand protein-like [Meriones unguiculatus]|uniref:FANCD2 opposite strand protein-like n=1 Tax=Meriones unguiculatus TaxID=10047 RepID=UPI000B4FA32B|nr:FANCD2 opposite strand protein-like [Meriones unguiculatus]
MASYRLWSPWTTLDENLRWLRRSKPTFSSIHPFRVSPCFPRSPSDFEVQRCFQEVSVFFDTPVVESVLSSELPSHPPEQWIRPADKRVMIRKPQPIRLIGLDAVFGSDVTIQPPKWTGTFRVSDTSAFSKIISKEQRWPTGLKEPQIEMTMSMCKEMLRSILLLYAIYKKCTFALQHSQ